MKTRWPWALVGAIVLVMVAGVLLTDRCYAEEHRFLVFGFGLSWFLAFMFFGKVVRISLLAAALGVCLLYQHSEFTPPAEWGAISTLRSVGKVLESFKQTHPSEGYPVNLPVFQTNCRARSVYEFRYSREALLTPGIAERFILVAVPTTPSVSRGLRSFALTEDGHIHSTSPNSRRPANRTDQVLE
jgi:hypothetical protein